KDGQIAYEVYFKDTEDTDRRVSWSMAKSFLSAAFGVAVNDGLVPDLDAQVTQYVPSLVGSAYDGATIRNVMNMSSGIKFNEDYLDSKSDINKMGRVLALGKSMDGFTEGQSESDREPGSRRKYVSIDTHVIGMVLRAATGKSVPDYLSETILKPLGLEADAYYLTDGFGTAFVLGGLNMRTRDYARFGLMMAQNGQLNGEQVVPMDWIKQSTSNSAPPSYDGDVGSDYELLGYGFQWWLPPNPTEGEFFAIGVYGQYIYVNQAENVVIAVNAVDRKFRNGSGEITILNLTAFREIVETLRNN
ncbi:MAG: CubicO group peptidase (beta-lactamase class C family), partial [Paracoccaceae bacterium]